MVCLISGQSLCAQVEWLNLEFQFTATNFMSMAAKLSDLGERTSRANLQMEGHVNVPSQSAEDQQESEALCSSPYHLPSCSLARRLPSGHPNTRYCLKIHITLIEKLGVVSPPPHSWVAPLVEDMLHDIRTGLIEVVVIGPGRAFLFYGRCSLGEGLTTYCIPAPWSGYMGLETSLPCCWSNDNSRRSTGNCQSHNGLLSKGKRTRLSMCKSINPTAL